jgi:pyrophosphatase PpaX
MITTVLFDFDGTLADTDQLILNSFKHIYSLFNDGKYDEEYVRGTFGEPLRTTMSRDFEQFNMEDVLARYREYQVQRFNDEVVLYETVKETLEYLKNKGIKMGVVTSRLKQSTHDALKFFNIAKYFGVVVTADDTEKHKPHKEPLIKALNELGSTTDETLYVGDSKFDMECAINAGVIPVLAGWHNSSKELQKKYNINYVIAKMHDLINLID